MNVSGSYTLTWNRSVFSMRDLPAKSRATLRFMARTTGVHLLHEFPRFCSATQLSSNSIVPPCSTKLSGSQVLVDGCPFTLMPSDVRRICGGRGCFHNDVAVSDGGLRSCREEGAAQYQLCAAWNLRIHPDRRPYVPRRHLSEIIIAGHTLRGVCPDGIQNFAHRLLRFPRLTEEVEKPRCLDGRLVVQFGMQAARFGNRQAAVGIIEKSIQPLRCLSLPPIMVNRPFALKGTIHRYWAALPSTNPSSDAGSNFGHEPSALRF